jgi:hypothetical protein
VIYWSTYLHVKASSTPSKSAQNSRIRLHCETDLASGGTAIHAQGIAKSACIPTLGTHTMTPTPWSRYSTFRK